MLFFQSTPLHLAAGYNRTRIVQLLLQHGADVHAKDKGYSYLYLFNEENKITAWKFSNIFQLFFLRVTYFLDFIFSFQGTRSTS